MRIYIFLITVLFSLLPSLAGAQCTMPASLTTSGPPAICATNTLALTVSYPASAWNSKAAFGGGSRSHAVGFSIGTKGYVGLGYDNSSVFTSDFWEYDPATNTWTQKTSYPGGATQYAVGFGIGTKGYVGSGSSNAFYEYDPATNTWTAKANFPGVNREGAVAMSIGTKGYIGLGKEIGGGALEQTDFYEYDPTANTWTSRAAYPGLGRFYCLNFSIGTKGYVGSGTALTVNTFDFWEFNPAGNNWTSRAAYPSAPYASGLTIGNKGYARSDGSMDFREYDPVGNTWTTRTNWLSVNRGFPIAFGIGNRGYFGTGAGIGTGDDFWEFVPPATQVWSTGSTAASITVSTTNTYTVQISDVVGCSVTLTQTVLVNPNPTISIAGATAVCVGSPVSFTASGASTYTWSANAGSSNSDVISISPTLADTYSVTGTDGNGCSGTAIKTITVNTLPNVTASAVVPVVCSGGTTALNGAGAITYTWTNGIINSATFTPPGSYAYSVTGTDANGCENSAAASIIVNAVYLVSASSSTSDVCSGSPVTLTGTGAFTYTWSNGVINAVPFSPTVTATYTVNATDVNGCKSSTVQTINVLGLPTVTASVSASVICNGFSTTLNSGGALTYTWSNGATNGIAFSPTITGTYTVTGADGNGCTNTAMQTVTVNNLPNVSGSATPPSVCIGGTTSLSGAGAITYTWAGGVVNGVPFSPLSTLTYSLSGTDMNGCENNAITTVTVNALPIVSASASALDVCYGFTATLSGGGAVTYSWTNGVINAVPFTPTITTTYTVTGTDANTCINTAVLTIDVHNLPIVTASVNPSVICNGFSTTLSSGGALTYTWSNGAISGTAFSPTITDTYTVTGTDGNGCTNTAMQTVTVNNLPNVSGSATSPVICLGGTTTLNGAGATTYTWTGGAINAVPFSPLSTLTYSVIGTDLNGCENNAITTVTVNALPLVSVSTSTTDLCYGFPATLSGAGAVTYTWTNGVVNTVPFTPTITATYTVTGTDANTCTNTAVQTISVHNLPIVTAAANPSVICIGFATILNGGGAATYTWTGGVFNGSAFSPTLTDTYTVTGTDGNGCINSAIRTITVNSLPNVTASAVNPVVCAGGTTALNGAGASTYTWTNGVINASSFIPQGSFTYSVTGTDANGCENTAAVLITVNAVYLVTANASTLDICSGFPVTLSGSGATTYTWSGGVGDGVPFSPTITSSYTVNATDINGCTSSAVQTINVHNPPVVTTVANPSVICTGLATILNGGGASTYTWTNGVINGSAFSPTVTDTYTVTGTDAYGCINTAMQTVTVNTLPNVTASAVNPVVCAGGTTALNGAGAITYTWTNGVINAAPFTPLGSFTYSVTGSDANGCKNSAAVLVTVNSIYLVTANASTLDICYGFPVTLSGSGATTYTWSGGVVNAVPFSPTITSTYTVNATDINGCKSSAIQTITVHNPPLITTVANPSVICTGLATILNGGGAVTYTWTNGVVNGSAFSPTLTSTYTVTGTDGWGCMNSAMQTVTVLSLPIVTGSASIPAICPGGTTTLNGAGASTYTWTNGVLNGVPFSPPSTIIYTVTGTDLSGCTNTAVTTVTIKPLPLVAINATTLAGCIGFSTALSAAGANTYTWANGVVNGVAFSPTTTLSYTLSGTGINSCTNTAVATVTVYNLPLVTTSASHSVICNTFSTSLHGGGASTYTWTNGVINAAAFSPTITKTYTVTATDLHGCINTAIQTVTVHNLPNVTSSAVNPVICFGGTTAVNGAGAITYTWTNGVTNAIAFTPATTITYTVTGTDANTCKNTSQTTVTVIPLPLVTANASTLAVCIGFSTSLYGGGANTYTWSHGISNGASFSPTSTITYTVSGTDVNTCTNTAVTTITVYNLPVVTGSASSPVICLNDYTTLNGIGAATYTWTNGAINNNPFTPTTTSSYLVTGKDIHGCVNTATQVVTVTVNPLPTVSGSAVNLVICKGGTTTLNAAGAVTYTWTSNVIDGVPFSPQHTITYTVTGTGTNGCKNKGVATVTVNQLPPVTANASSLAVCYGFPTTLTGGGATTYTWSDGINDGVAFSPTVTTTYTVTGTDVNTCTNTAVKTIVVNSLPTISAYATKTVVCEGLPVTLIGSGAQTYTWTGGITNAIAFTPTASGSYTLTGTSLEGCASSNTEVINILVNVRPTITVNNGAICTGQSFTLIPGGAVSYTYNSPGLIISPTVTSTYSFSGSSPEGCTNLVPAISTITVYALPNITLSSVNASLCAANSTTVKTSGASTYTWNTGSNSTSLVITPAVTTSFTVTGTDVNTCVNSASLTVLVVANPILSLSASTLVICEGSEITFTASGASGYLWNTSQTNSLITVRPASSTIYKVSGFNSNCSDTKTIAITVNPIPVVNAGPDEEIEEGQIYTLKAEQNYGSIFRWTDSTGLSNPALLNPTFLASQTVNYKLTVTSAAGCAASDDVTITVPEALLIANYMSPNGDGKNDTWKIDNLYRIRNCSVQIIDSWGVTVFSKERDYANEFDAYAMPDGVYYYFLKEGSAVKYKGNITITH